MKLKRVSKETKENVEIHRKGIHPNIILDTILKFSESDEDIVDIVYSHDEYASVHTCKQAFSNVLKDLNKPNIKVSLFKDPQDSVRKIYLRKVK